jgi:hypothetical protein
MKTLSNELRQYLATALWSSSDLDDKDGEPLDRKYNLEDFSAEALAQAEKDWTEFKAQAGSLLDGLELDTVAHDFWLTRNHHGAGFWDGDYSKPIGEALTKLAHKFGEVDPYAGDDGKIYFL